MVRNIKELPILRQSTLEAYGFIRDGQSSVVECRLEEADPKRISGRLMLAMKDILQAENVLSDLKYKICDVNDEVLRDCGPEATSDDHLPQPGRIMGFRAKKRV